MNAPFLICFVLFVFFAVAIPWASRHDRVLAELEAVDYDALADDANTRFEDDADSWRKGES